MLLNCRGVADVYRAVKIDVAQQEILGFGCYSLDYKVAAQIVGVVFLVPVHDILNFAVVGDVALSFFGFVDEHIVIV